MNTKKLSILATCLAITAIFAPVTAQSQEVDPSLFQALEWRNIGPFRGGRVPAVAGHPVDHHHDFSLLEIMMMVDMMDPPLTQGLMSRVTDVRERWSSLENQYQAILDNELDAINSVITELSIPAISASEGKSR